MLYTAAEQKDWHSLIFTNIHKKGIGCKTTGVKASEFLASWSVCTWEGSILCLCFCADVCADLPDPQLSGTDLLHLLNQSCGWNTTITASEHEHITAFLWRRATEEAQDWPLMISSFTFCSSLRISSRMSCDQTGGVLDEVCVFRAYVCVCVMQLLTCLNFSMSVESPVLLPGLVLREEAKHMDLHHADAQTSRNHRTEARRTCSTEPRSQETPGSCPDS